jgi:hypothetical protein
MLHSVIISTLGQLATGILLFILFVPVSQIGKGFGRFHTGLAAALWLLALYSHISVTFIVLMAVLSCAFFLAGNQKLYSTFVLGSVAISFWLLLSIDAQSSGWIRSILANVPATLVLGASSVAMLLGHWYLVAPKLSIQYLKTLTIGLIVALVLRAALITGVLVKDASQFSANHFWELYGIFIAQRVLLGVVLSLILSVLTYFCVRIRSTQSATGILYVVLVFCLAGELIGNYLFTKTGIFL